MTTLELTLDLIRTVATVAVPIVVAVLGYRLNRRLKLYEASQWRNQELIKARLTYYQSLAPKLNDLMCYFTFIGSWKQMTPPDVVRLKRELDREFYSALPLFSTGTDEAYQKLMGACFATFGRWGEDAKLRTGYVRRRQAIGHGWQPDWERMFTHAEDQHMPREELSGFRSAYDGVLRALARDIELIDARDRYATAEASLNAY